TCQRYSTLETPPGAGPDARRAPRTPVPPSHRGRAVSLRDPRIAAREADDGDLHAFSRRARPGPRARLWRGLGPRDRLARLACVRRSEFLGQCDEDALGAADVAQPVEVLVLLDLADELGAVRLQAGKDVVDVLDGEHDATYAQCVRRCVRFSGGSRRR